MAERSTAAIADGSPPTGTNRVRRDTLALAVLIQGAILAITVFVVVVVPRDRDEPEFKSRPTIFLPQRELEHRVAVSEFQQAAAQPLQLERLVTTALLPPDLPALPTVPKTDFDPLDRADFLTRDAQALLAQSGMMGAVSGLKSAASTAAFFGIEDSGERIVVVVNTSVSVRNKAQRRGVPWERIQQEAAGLIERLEPGTLFGIVQFSQGVRLFSETVAPAVAANREAAAEWIRRNLRGNPPVAPDQAWFGHEAAFEAALRLEPDVIFLVTDGVLDRREEQGRRVTYPRIAYPELSATLQRFKRSAAREVRIHVVGFELDSRAGEDMRSLVRDFRGQLREF